MNWRAILWGAAAGAIAGSLVTVVADWKLEWALLQGMWQCWGAPPVVEFRQGMTLCPGQSAEMHVTIPLPPTPLGAKKDDGI